jgi:hypothetical protein
MMNTMELEVGDVVQLNPDHKYSGLLLVVTEPKEWGCQGYLMSQFNFEATRFQGVAYLRAKFEEFEYIGQMRWVWEPKELEKSNDP